MSNSAMSNETNLDWLARNVHVWPAGDHQPWCYVYMVAGGAMKASGNFLDAVTSPTMITEDQWLSRRAELQNKPSWDAVPNHANWLTQDAAGTWLWHSSEPECSNGMWVHSTTKGYAARGYVLGDWRDTLEKRPEQTIADICREVTGENRHEEIFEPFVSVEDAQQELSELEMLAKVSHLISDKRHRITPSKYTKTIRGVSVDVYDVLQAWGVSNPALQHLIKKALQCGQRGHKDNEQDLQDIIDSAIRAKELG
jgi:hypothetical protein